MFFPPSVFVSSVAEEIRPLRPDELGGIRIWNDARTASFRSPRPGYVRLRWSVQMKNETPRELASTTVRLVFEDGGRRTFVGDPVVIRRFSNLSAPHVGSLLPYNKSVMDDSVWFEAPAKLWHPSTYAHPEFVGAETYRHADLHDAGHLYTKLSNSRRPEILALFKKDPTLLRVKNDQNMTITLMAFATCDTEVIKYVLAHGGNAKDVTTRNATIMHSAAVNGYPGVVALASKLGAKVDGRTKNGKTPLCKAITAGQPVGWQALLKLGADPRDDRGGWTPAHYAVQEGMKPALDDLVKAGVKPSTIDKLGQGWYHYAVFNSIFFDVLSGYGIPIDERGKSGETPLMVAAWSGWLEPQVWLLRHGADPNLKDRRGWSAYDYAAHRGQRGPTKKMSLIEKLRQKQIEDYSRNYFASLVRQYATKK